VSPSLSPQADRSASVPDRTTLPLLLAYMGMVFALSHLSHPPLPQVLSDLSDKVLHAAEYLPLGYLCARAYRGPARRRALLGWLTAALFGLTDEFHQSFVPGRDASLWDWVADLGGAAAGAALLYWAARRFRRKESSELAKVPARSCRS